jgi:uncharacterized membrane protein YhhN
VNTPAWILFALTLAIAMVEWFAVHTENQRLVYVTKPATMVPLIGAALAVDATIPAMRHWFVLALVCSLAGDVFLMLPKPETYFVPGLASFLVGHVFYIVGLTRGPMSTTGLIVGAVVTFTSLAAIGPTLVKGASEVDRRLGLPVLAYMLTISVMVTCAVGAGPWLGIVGAVLFYLSDFCIGWSRFVQPFRHSHLVIMVTYHLAQVCLIASLTATRG